MRWFVPCAALTPADVEKNLNAVRTLVALANGRYEEAHKLASAAATEPSGNQRNSMFVAGVAAYRLGQWDNAIKMFQTLSGYGFKNVIYTEKGKSGRIWVEDYLLSQSRAAEKFSDKCN